MVKAGDKKRGRKGKEEGGFGGKNRSDRHKDTQREEKTRGGKKGRGGSLWVPGMSGM